MQYVPWAILSMVTYGVSAALLKLAFRSISPAAGLTIANLFVVSAGATWWIIQGAAGSKGLGTNAPTGLLVLASIILATSIVALYKALSLGPASAVVPIFAMNLTVAAILGFTLLGEPLKLPHIAGLVSAGLAVFLLTR